MCGACHFDVPPTFGLPIHYLPSVPTNALLPPSYRLLNLTWTWNKLYPSNTEFISLLQDVHIVNSIICARYPDIFNDPWFLGLQINPVLLRLLSFPGINQDEAQETEADSGSDIERAIRLATLIYFADLRTEFMLYHVTGYHFIKRIGPLILANSERWHYFQDIRLWALVMYEFISPLFRHIADLKKYWYQSISF